MSEPNWSEIEAKYPPHPLRRHFVRCTLPVEMCDACRTYSREVNQ